MRHPWFLVLAAIFLAAFTMPLSGQQGGGDRGGGLPSATGSTTDPGRTRQPRSPMPDFERRNRTIIIISGRVQSGSGNPGEQIRVEFWNHGQILQAVFSDLRGNFTFTFDGNQGQRTSRGNSAVTSDASYSAQQNRFRNSGFGFPGDVGAMVRGGEIRVHVAGFHPVNKPVRGPLSMVTDVGTITLERQAKIEGTAVSLTSLQAPKKARKELNKAAKLLKKSKTEEAAEHLRKAVEIYPQYAVAWNWLGDIYLRQDQPEKARQAFSESMKADPKYIRPYLGQATIPDAEQAVCRPDRDHQHRAGAESGPGTGELLQSSRSLFPGTVRRSRKERAGRHPKPERVPADSPLYAGVAFGPQRDVPGGGKRVPPVPSISAGFPGRRRSTEAPDPDGRPAFHAAAGRNTGAVAIPSAIPSSRGGSPLGQTPGCISLLHSPMFKSSGHAGRRRGEFCAPSR